MKYLKILSVALFLCTLVHHASTEPTYAATWSHKSKTVYLYGNDKKSRDRDTSQDFLDALKDIADENKKALILIEDPNNAPWPSNLYFNASLEKLIDSKNHQYDFLELVSARLLHPEYQTYVLENRTPRFDALFAEQVEKLQKFFALPENIIIQNVNTDGQESLLLYLARSLSNQKSQKSFSPIKQAAKIFSQKKTTMHDFFFSPCHAIYNLAKGYSAYHTFSPQLYPLIEFLALLLNKRATLCINSFKDAESRSCCMNRRHIITDLIHQEEDDYLSAQFKAFARSKEITMLSTEATVAQILNKLVQLDKLQSPSLETIIVLVQKEKIGLIEHCLKALDYTIEKICGEKLQWDQKLASERMMSDTVTLQTKFSSISPLNTYFEQLCALNKTTKAPYKNEILGLSLITTMHMYPALAFWTKQKNELTSLSEIQAQHYYYTPEQARFYSRLFLEQKPSLFSPEAYTWIHKQK